MSSPKFVLGKNSSYIGTKCPFCMREFKFGDRICYVYRQDVLAYIMHDDCTESFDESYAKKVGAV